MSQENVEVVRAVIEAYNAGDWPHIHWLDPGIEWWDRRATPARRSIAGTRASAHFWLSLARQWSFVVDAKEFVDAGDYVVVCLRSVWPRESQRRGVRRA